MSEEKDKSQEKEKKEQPSQARTLFTSLLFLAAVIAAPIFSIKMYESWHNQESNPKIEEPKENLRAGMPTSDPAARPSMKDAISFNVTPDWMLQYWPRVAECYSDVRVLTYRVPLVTGIEPHDLAGSLTYDFDHQQRLLRIKFVGTTGDVSKLIEFAKQQFNLIPRQTNNPNLFVFEAALPATSNRQLMHIKFANVQKSGDLHKRFDVTLQLFRPAKNS